MSSLFLLILGILQLIFMVVANETNGLPSLELTIILTAFGLSLKECK